MSKFNNLVYCVEDWNPHPHFNCPFLKGNWYNIDEGQLGLSGSSIRMYLTYKDCESRFIDYNSFLILQREDKINQIILD
jgi:hypothetical protein